MMGLRDEALRLFQAAIAAADPAGALRRALLSTPIQAPSAGGAWILIAVGKAAVPMAGEALRHLTGAPVRALVVTNYENARPVAGAEIMTSGHPVPDENGARAGAAVAALLESAGPSDRVVALISGGGSALLPAPAPGLTLEDKAAVNRLLLAHGYEITEINLIRQQLSRLKGGGMLRLAAPAPVQAFILSDVIGDDLRHHRVRSDRGALGHTGQCPQAAGIARDLGGAAGRGAGASVCARGACGAPAPGAQHADRVEPQKP